MEMFQKTTTGQFISAQKQWFGHLCRIEEDKVSMKVL